MLHTPLVDQKAGLQFNYIIMQHYINIKCHPICYDSSRNNKIIFAYYYMWSCALLETLCIIEINKNGYV